MKRPYCLGYDPKSDNFNHYLFIYPAALVLTILFHINGKKHQWFDYCWSFSVWLEALAIIPQLYIVYKKREVEIITGSYMACLGCYKVFYVMSWIYQWINNTPLLMVKVVAGIIQITLYLDFLYYYFISAKVSANTIKLPV